MHGMTLFLLATTLLFAALAAGLLIAFRSLRVRAKRRWLFSPWPVPKHAAAALDDVLRLDPPRFATAQAASILGPLKGGSSTEILESWVLSAAAREAHTLFEFGTCTGRTTLMLALNSPADARIHTLTLHPDHFAQDYQAEGQDIDRQKWLETARKESTHTEFLYHGTPVESKVAQYFGDSKKFDTAPLANACDLIFIDGGHSLSYVTSDTEKAFEMIAPGGLIFWHDYKHTCPGVFQYLNDLSRRHAIVHVADTYLAVYRDPRAA